MLHIEMNEKNVDKFYLFTSVASNNQLITSSDCHAALSLPDGLHECLWIKKWLTKSGLVWRRTLSVPLSMHGEIVSLLAFVQWADISGYFTAGIWETKRSDEMSANVSKMCFCQQTRRDILPQ